MSNYRLLRGRFSIAGNFYHINTTTKFRRPILNDFKCARIVALSLRELELEQAARTFCFVIMPDHLHWLMQLCERKNLGDVIKLLKGRSARRINQERGICGSLWQSDYFERAIRNSEELLKTGMYIVENPVRAGLVDELREYPHWDGVWLRELKDGWSD